MTLETLRAMLAWCTVFDLLLLFWWFGFFVFAHDFVYRIHSRWFPMPVDRFDAIHYSGMAFLKLGMILLHLGPYLALRIVG
jgi:hypothetical protein